MARSAGEAAYEMWCERVASKDVATPRLEALDLVSWEKLPIRARETWESIARAVIKYTTGSKG